MSFRSAIIPLLFAVRNNHIDAVKVLLAHGANVNDVAPDTTSALGIAVVNGDLDMASMLLEKLRATLLTPAATFMASPGRLPGATQTALTAIQHRLRPSLPLALLFSPSPSL